ncbi:4-alpha-glucanotransferase, partial [Candidatus Aerophobetes bacterium]|nr:4-alpha-glucanotransferase [Candidatus Aerophobetes bacterium]
DRHPSALIAIKNTLGEDIQREKFFQFLFFRQWFSLKKYCNLKGISIIGDLPIYPTYDSVDVWANPEIFKLDQRKAPLSVAGVPPDYFSKTGQLWGNPVYRWDVLKEQKYRWWIKRISHSLFLFDIVRIDHFRGFVGFWEVPAGEKTAAQGRWTEAPAEDFFKTVSEKFPHLPFIAEDLGFITPDVRYIMQKFNIPGMKVLLFAFGEDTGKHPYAPHNHVKNCVVYTGTHDTNTARGWFEEEASSQEKERFFCYIGREILPEEVSKEFIRLAMMSVAALCILPMQDILGLASEGRMNIPSTSRGNWEWRLLPEDLESPVTSYLREFTRIYGRC